MSIKKDLVIKVSNGVASLDMPLQIYEKDHGIELRFKLMDYKYKYDKDPDNILNSNKEDILEAYTTIVNPSGHELSQINGEVVDDTVKLMIEDFYTDELEELGTYQLQIHVKCKHSEFSIPPVQFDVLERLKGEKVVTDGDDEVDYSDIIDGSTKFIDDETGKLIIQWQKGDTISSVRLNAMVEVINNAVDEEAQRQLKELEREQQELEREQQELEREQQELEREQQELERENRLQAALNSVDARVDESMDEYETRFNALTASQQQDMEVIDARDGEVSLKARLDRDIEKAKQIYVDVEGTNISTDSSSGYAKDVEILGNTVQDASNLADIRSVGDKVEGQELYKIDIVSCGKNLFDGNFIKGFIETAGILDSNATDKDFRGDKYILCKPNTNYKGAYYTEDKRITSLVLHFFDKDYKKISFKSGYEDTLSPENAKYIMPSFYSNNPVVKGIVITENENTPNQYEPYQEDKLTILSPVQLEKVGGVADRIICKDGVWGVEKNVETKMFDENNDYRIMQLGAIGLEDYTSFCTPINAYPSTSSNGCVISDKFIWSGSVSVNDNRFLGKALSVHSNGNIYFRLLKSELVSDDSQGFKDWIKNNNTLVKFATKTPQFIPLPHDQQIKLRTFAGRTNIHFETEIEGTIKAQVPKSLGATVNTHTSQIDNLNKELDRVKKLEESTVSTVTTESGFTTVAETSNGYFEDVKLEGKTLVNKILNNRKVLRGLEDTEIKYVDYQVQVKPSTEYTVVLFISKNTSSPDTFYNWGAYIDSATQGSNNICKQSKSIIEVGGSLGVYALKFTTKDSITDSPCMIIGLHRDWGIYEFEADVMILEGDHTQNPPSFFEGLKSVGDGVDEISVVSTDDGNMWDGVLEYGSLGAYTGVEAISTNHNRSKNYIYVIEDLDYYVNIGNTSELEKKIRLIFYKYEGEYHSYMDVTKSKVIKIPKGVSCMRFVYQSTEKIYNISITKGSEPKEYQPSNQDKKRLLYYNDETQTWEKPILREWDSIEKHSDGKYYYHKRSGEVVLNGSEDWLKTASQPTSGKHSRFIITNFPKDVVQSPTAVICDRYNNQKLFNESSVGIYVDKNTNITVDGVVELEAFKQNLQANPVTAVYQLAQEEVYECTNIDLITYENETNYIVNSGAIAPKSSLKVMSNIGNVVRELQQKVSNLENYIQHVIIDALKKALDE